MDGLSDADGLWLGLTDGEREGLSEGEIELPGGGTVNIHPDPAVAVAWLSVELAPAYQVVPGVATECWIFR